MILFVQLNLLSLCESLLPDGWGAERRQELEGSWIMYTVYCILYTVFCILYTALESYIITVYCILYTVYYILYTALESYIITKWKGKVWQGKKISVKCKAVL